MKTTLDLPETLLRQVQHRAEREGRKLQDAVADLLRKGLAVVATEEQTDQEPVVSTDNLTGLPVIVCKHATAAGADMTPERVAALLLEQEVDWHHDPGG